ncbi:unnamed protein product [Sphagnum balticum]
MNDSEYTVFDNDTTDDDYDDDCQRWDRIGSSVSLCTTFSYPLFVSHRPLDMNTIMTLTFYQSTAIYSLGIVGTFFNALVLYMAFTCVDFSVKVNQVGSLGTIIPRNHYTRIITNRTFGLESKLWTTRQTVV